MALYVDSAYLKDVEEVCTGYPVGGVTTNPTILLAAIERGQRLNDVEVLRHLLDLCSGPVFMQPTAVDVEGLRAAALRYVEVDAARVVLKLPMNGVGMKAALMLAREKMHLSFTAVATVAQAYCGMLAGAAWIIPYFGRLRRSGVDPCQVITDMARVMSIQAGAARILAASVKSPSDVVEATLAGAHDVTAPPEVIRALTEDALSEDAVARFAADWARVQVALHLN
ncbi:MAG: transaldolase family protein, partial [Ktedonobacterales bacterium]